MHLVEQLECPFVDKFFSKVMAHWRPENGIKALLKHSFNKLTLFMATCSNRLGTTCMILPA